ncbi:hypothetical protein B0H34DRAFT_677699 [Crassisporium funariophilum]|nr:hypothetical protein B0H34DRAFT_677699 [Crassisporium funariophilum]
MSCEWYYTFEDNEETGPSSVFNWTGLQCYLQLQRFWPSKKSLQWSGQPCALIYEDMTFRNALLDANPCLYLDKMQQKLKDIRDVHVSLPTISKDKDCLAGQKLAHTLTTIGIALEIIEGSITKEKFLNFLCKQAPQLNPYPGNGKQSVVILDNCTIHHNVIQELIEDQCGQNKFLCSSYFPPTLLS